MKRRFFVFVAVALLAACGGGGHGGVTPPTGGGTPTPTSSPTSAPTVPATQSLTLTMSPSGPVTGTFPAIASGAAGSVTLPATSSGTSSATLTLQSGAPSGDPTPDARRRMRIALRGPKNLGASVTPLAYVSFSLASAVTIGQSPSFMFTFPAGTLSGYGYVALYDSTNPSRGWTEVLGPVNATGTQISFSATTISPAITLSAGVNYVFAIVETGTPLPTPTPTPTAAPTSNPTSAPTPADCPASFTSASGGAPLNITDDSGLPNAQLLVYVLSGGKWLSNDGTFDSTSPNPLPAACFSTTTGSSGTKALNVPANAGGRIYFVYVPNPGTSTIPNPLPTMSNANPVPGYAAYSANPYPWDVIEYTTTSGSIIDTTQVNNLGFPLELSVGATPLPVTTPGAMPAGAPAPCPTDGPPSQIVGVTSCNFANVFLAMEQNTQYQSLVLAQPFPAGGSTIYDLQVLAPNSAQDSSFQWNLFGNSLPSSPPASCPSTPTYGYLSCVLAAYANTPRLFTSNVPGAGTPSHGGPPGPDYVTGDNYCIGSDGSQNFIATDVGSSTTCSPSPAPTSPPYQFKINVYNFMYGTPPANDNGGVTACKANILFAQPWGLADVNNTAEAAQSGYTTGMLFANDDAFALWKALTADLVYGTALAPVPIHPAGINQSGGVTITPGTVFSTLFQDPMYDQYDYTLHKYFNSNMTYGLAYDDLYNLESYVKWYPGDPIDVRINAIPTSTSTWPASAPTPVPAPSTCPTLSAPIGSF